MPVKRPARAALPLRRQLEEAVRAIRRQSRLQPEIALVLGSGLGGLVKALKIDAAVPYAKIPHLTAATAPGHEGQLILGTLGRRRVVVLAGRFHGYEGYAMAQVSFPVRLVRALGAQTLMLTSIVGSMNPKMPSGSLVLLEDHLNLMGMNPLIGPNDEQLGPRFPDMSQPYDPELRALARQVAQDQQLPLREGVYAAVAGPNLETRAEYRFLRQIGADVVGMSMVPEVLTARHGNMRVLAVVVVSDACIPEDLQPASVEALLRVAAATEPSLTRLLTGVVAAMDKAAVVVGEV